MPLQEKGLIDFDTFGSGSITNSRRFSFVRDFVPYHTYQKDNVIYRDGIIYRAWRDFHATDTFNINDWQPITFLADIVITDFQPNTTTSKDTVIFYNNYLWRAKADFITGEEFDINDWEQIAINSVTKYLTVTDTLNVQSGIPEIPVDWENENIVNAAVGQIVDKIDFTGGYSVYAKGSDIARVERSMILTGVTTGLQITIYRTYGGGLDASMNLIRISAGSPTTSKNIWAMGYGGWQGQTSFSILELIGEQTAKITQAYTQTAGPDAIGDGNDALFETNTIFEWLADPGQDRVPAVANIDIANVDHLILNAATGTSFVPTLPPKDNSNSIANTGYVDRADNAIEANVQTLQDDFNAWIGRGGYLDAYDFGTPTPTQTQLTNYALSQIPSATDPTMIWNGTKIVNLNNGDLWILTNTQDTDPVVFEWANQGPNSIGPFGENDGGYIVGGDPAVDPPETVFPQVSGKGMIDLQGIKNLFFSIGSIVITNSNINPSGKYGGTWQLINKICISKSFNFTVDGVGFTKNATNTTSFSLDIWITNNNLFIRLNWNTAVVLDNTTKIVGTLKFTDFGLSKVSYATHPFAWTANGNGIVSMFVNQTTGSVEARNVITRASNGTIPAGTSDLFMEQYRPINMDELDDSIVNEWHWERTA